MYRFDRLSSRGLFFACFCGVLCSLDLITAHAVELKVDPSFTLESWFIYDDNIYLTTRRALEADISDPNRHQPGKSDVIGRLFGQLRLDYGVKEGNEEIVKGYLSYEYAGQLFGTEHDENNFQQLVEGEAVFLPNEPLSLCIYGGTRWDERKSRASYGLLDNSKTWVGVETRFRATEMDLLSVGYEYGFRDYQTSEARTVPSSYDYTWHRISGKYVRTIVEGWSAEVSAGLRWRDYDQQARQAQGLIIPGRDREDRYPELGAQLTGELTPKTALRVGYKFAQNLSSGSFYQFHQHRAYALVLQNITDRLDAYAYVHRQWKPYDDQTAYLDPLGTRVSNGIRDDREWLGLVGLEYKLTEHLAVMTECSRTSHHSNDETSAYRGNRYSVGMLCRF